MNIHFDHLEKITSFLAMEILARAQELESAGREIIHLENQNLNFPQTTRMEGEI